MSIYDFKVKAQDETDVSLSDYKGKIVCFGTSAMMKSMKKPMKKVAEAYGAKLADEEFHCRGEFKIANKGRPNAEDLQKAALFAERVVKTNE